MNLLTLSRFLISKKFLLSAAFVSLFVLFIYSSLYITEEQTEIIVNRLGVFGPVFIYLTFLASQVVAPLSGSPIAFIGFKLYGYTHGLVILYLAYLSSMTINFLVARDFGVPVVGRMIGEERLKRVEEISLRRPAEVLAPARLLLTGSADVINYIMGLSSIRPQAYFIISALVPLIPNILFWILFRDLNFHSLTDITYFYTFKITIDAISYGLFVLILMYQKRIPTPKRFVDALIGGRR